MPRTSLWCVFPVALLLLAPGLAAAAPGARTAAATRAAATPSHIVAATNQLENPGFEESLPGHTWMPVGWDTSSAGLPSVFFGRDTLLSHSGKYAVSVANLSTLFPLQHNWSQTKVVDRRWWGKDVVFSAWTKSNGLEGRAFIRLELFQDTLSKMAVIWHVPRERAGDSLNIKTLEDPKQELGWRHIYFSDPETEWTRREVRVFVPPTVNIVRVSMGIQGTGQVLFDDASLTLEPARPAPPVTPHVNLIADPGFEGNCNAWEYSMPPYQGFRIIRDSTVMHSGRASIRFSGGEDGLFHVNAGVCQAFPNRNLAGKKLRITAWCKTDSLSADAMVLMYFKTPHGTEHPVPVQRFSGTTDWTLQTLDFDAPPDTYEVWAWYMYDAPANGKCYFDDCTLEVLGPATTHPKPPARPPKRKT